MSHNYAAALSKYPNKGILGIPEVLEEGAVIAEKVSTLADMIREAKHIVVHTGAGLSTAAGIPDFRGPNGVWTCEKRRKRPPQSESFTNVVPTFTHMALKKMVECGLVKFIVSQNIDGLHIRSGIPPDQLAELHGNIYGEKCKKCRRMFLRRTPCPTLGMKPTGDKCELLGNTTRGQTCRGTLVDTVLDWRNSLPEEDLYVSEAHARVADLSIVLGSTLQIVPAGELPFTRKRIDGSAKTVICNLQKTKFDDDMDLIIHARVDTVFTLLMQQLQLRVDPYDSSADPIWQIPIKQTRVYFERLLCSPGEKSIALSVDYVGEAAARSLYTDAMGTQESQTSFPSSEETKCNVVVKFEENKNDAKIQSGRKSKKLKREEFHFVQTQ